MDMAQSIKHKMIHDAWQYESLELLLIRIFILRNRYYDGSVELDLQQNRVIGLQMPFADLRQPSELSREQAVNTVQGNERDIVGNKSTLHVNAQNLKFPFACLLGMHINNHCTVEGREYQKVSTRRTLSECDIDLRPKLRNFSPT